MPTRIVFGDGTSITVTADAQEVSDRLERDKRGAATFTHFEAQGAGDVYVAADRVAYIQQVGQAGFVST